MNAHLARQFFRLGSSIAFRTTGRAYTADDVIGSAIKLAARMPDEGYAINLCEDRLQFAIGFVAAVMKGHVLLLPQNRKPATLASLSRSYPGCYCLIDQGAPDYPEFTCLESAVLQQVGPLKTNLPMLADDQLCALVFTSGSTGLPQANRKYWKTLVQGTSLNEDYLWSAVASAPSILATVPPQHMYGLETTILAPLFLPVTAISRTAFFPADIVAALEAMPRPRVLVSTPIHLRALMATGLALPPVDLVLCATAPLDPGLAREIERACGGVLREVYGCTEAGSFAWREPVRESRWELFREFNLTIDPGETRLLADHLPEPVRLQDTIVMDNGGKFRLLGRLGDLVNIAGKRASLADLNLKLLSIPGVQDGIITHASQPKSTEIERLIGLVVTDLDPSTLHRELEKLVDSVFIPRPLLRVEHIPRGPAGKIDRASIDRLLSQARHATKPCRGLDA